MKVPIVSIVVPAYNAESTLARTIESALRQTFSDFELIVVDDGSTDNTVSVAKTLQDKDARVKLISKSNSGVSGARNVGIQASCGEYVALLDSDDLWVPHKLKRQLSEFEANSDLEAVQSGAYFVNNSLEILHAWPCFPSVDPLLETLLFQNLPNIMSTLIIKRETLDKIGYFDTDLEILEDWELAIRISRHCSFISIEEPLSLYRVHPGNRSRDSIGIHLKSGVKVLNRLFNDSHLPERIRKQKRLIYSHFYAMLSGGSIRASKKIESIKWAVKAALVRPAILIYIVSMPLRMLERKRSQTSGTEKYHFDPDWFSGMES